MFTIVHAKLVARVKYIVHFPSVGAYTMCSTVAAIFRKVNVNHSTLYCYFKAFVFAKLFYFNGISNIYDFISFSLSFTLKTAILFYDLFFIIIYTYISAFYASIDFKVTVEKGLVSRLIRITD